jgi:hypothetical protein
VKLNKVIKKRIFQQGTKKFAVSEIVDAVEKISCMDEITKGLTVTNNMQTTKLGQAHNMYLIFLEL